uniref:Uncharacterized protein n=1 Tax=Hyaloperonospora arabidopsidis (strain Emoy2) TaxID=559515 RepID=M4C0N5_HYAAE
MDRWLDSTADVKCHVRVPSGWMYKYAWPEGSRTTIFWARLALWVLESKEVA